MNNKIALITESDQGMGLSAASHLAQKGVSVILTGVSPSKHADSVLHDIRQQGGQACMIDLNVCAPAQFAPFVRRLQHTLRQSFGRQTFDYLVNNAGFGRVNTLMDTTEEEFDALFNINVKSVFFLTQHLLPLIEDHGRILNVSSGLTRFSLPGYASFAIMKGAIEVFTRYLAQEVGPRGIAVNTIAPGAIHTDFGAGALRNPAELEDFLAAATAMGRAGMADDIGAEVASLLTHSSQWLTAQRIEVSGGMNI